jgi:MFS family permease
MPSPQARRARAAVGAVFFTNGALYANVVPRYPQLKADLGFDNATLGTALAAFPLGALLAGLLATTLINRFGSARLASGGIVVLAGLLALVGVAHAWIVLATVFLLAGAVDALVDVAQNTHGLRVQRVYGRSIVNSFHGVWSIGAVAGGLMGAAAAGLDLSLPVHLAISSTLFSAVALVASRFLLPGADTLGRPTAPDPGRGVRAGGRRRSAVRMLAALGLLAACGAFVEDAGASWSALFLTDRVRTSAATAGMAFVAFASAMTIGRLGGDRMVDRFGQRRVVRTGGALAAASMAAALAVPSAAGTIAGFALAGLGVATLVPAAMHAADEIPGLRPGLGLTVVSWLLRVGFLVSPVLVGFVADLTSLRVGLLTVVAAGCTVVVVGRVLADGGGSRSRVEPGGGGARSSA